MEKSKRTTDNIVPVSAVRAARATNESVTAVIARDIAGRAYELYCERGRQHGYDLEDWLQAEGQLRGAASAAVA